MTGQKAPSACSLDVRLERVGAGTGGLEEAGAASWECGWSLREGRREEGWRAVGTEAAALWTTAMRT